MEKVIETRQEVLDFLRVDEYPIGSGDGFGDGSGDGSGYGYGDGNGSGYGYGSGDGFSDGSGSGDGCGDGSGYGDGYNILAFNGQPVHIIDDVPTLIDSIHADYARGRILRSDLTTVLCYIAKRGNYFAHGETLKEALNDAAEKYELNTPLEDRIRHFNARYPDREKPVPAKELFSWHHILTGSCLMGRKNFCKEHGINLDKSYTVKFFIDLTSNAYGKEAIRQLKETKP